MKIVTALLVGLAALAATAFAQSDARVTDLGDGYVRVTAETYSIEVPKGWAVGRETRWGQRDAKPADGSGKLGVMTAGPSRASWDDLYRTSLYFIMREDEGTATKYTLSKTAEGLEAMSFSVLDKDGFAQRRYVLVKNTDGRVLALSVEIPSKAGEKKWASHFDRLVKTARFR